VKLLPGPQVFILLAKGFQSMAVPALKAEGVRVQGTRWIARALDELEPARPLFPSDDPARRKAVEDAERWGEGFQNATRRIFYCAARRDPRGFLSVMSAERGPVKRVVLRVMAPIVIRLATGAHRALDEHGREDLALLPERLDRIDAWIEDGLLDGPELNAADFQIAANVAALMLSDDIRPFVEDRPAAAFARRVAPDYQGELGPCLPYEWLGPLRDHRDAPRPVTTAA
jgi:glutathione S-transferase